jgi:RimJ/RimL family protein N-acetyltransferase
MTISFEEITKETLFIAHEIVNSNSQYNVLENGREARTLTEIEIEFFNEDTLSVFIKLDDTYIGIIDFMEKNPNDHYPWLGLLMIHSNYQGYGFGFQSYLLYEEWMVQQGLEHVRLGVLESNERAQTFWESLGFRSFKTVTGQHNKEIICYEKRICEVS